MMERFWVKESHSVSLFCSDDGSQFCHHTQWERKSERNDWD